MKFFSFTGALMCLLILLNINRAYAQVSVITSIQGASVVCLPVNSTMNYSVSASNAPTSYSWSYTGPSGGIIINNPTASSTSISYQLPFANNTYTLHCYAINSFGNSSVVAFVMHVFETPSVTFSGSQSVCQGASANLSASPTIFQAGSTTISYSWSPATGLSSTSSATVTANPPASTNYTVLLSNGPCTNTNYLNVIINPLPILNVTANPGAICAGQTSFLNIQSNANSYSINTSPTPSYVPVSPSINTTYTITGSNSNGCNGVPVYITLTVNPTPVLFPTFNPPAICVGNASTLSIGGNAFNYTVNGTAVSNSLVVSPVNTSTYNVHGISSHGCPSATQQIILPVNQLPAVSAYISNSIICKGETTNIVLSGTAASYSLNGTSCQPIVTVNPSSSSVYTIVGRDVNGCEKSISSAVIVNACLAVVEIDRLNNPTNIYPNPNNGSFSITSGANQVALILNEIGQTLQQVQLLEDKETKIVGLTPGIYFIVTPKSRKKIIVTEN